jgi:outer membrane protein assembly factor BamB
MNLPVLFRGFELDSGGLDSCFFPIDKSYMEIYSHRSCCEIKLLLQIEQEAFVMKKANRRTIVLNICIIALCASCIFAQDWPQWRGPDRDAKVTGFTVPETWPKELTQKWKVTVGEGCSTPALVDDKLYVFTRQGNEEVTMCLKANDGTELWKNKYETIDVEGGPSRDFTGPRSSPTVADGKVITLGVGGVLSCLGAENGNVIWRNDDFPGSWPEFYTAMSPIIVDGLCIAHLGKKGQGAIMAYDLVFGEDQWRWFGDGPTYSSPVLMTVDGVEQLVVQTEKNLVGIAVADGKLLWKIETPNERRYYSSATPIVDGQTVYYTGQGTGSRAVKIKKEGDSFVTEELWCNEQLGTSFNTPVLKNGMLFGLSDGSNFYCMNAQNGQTAWKDTNKIERFGSIIDAGSCLLALSPQSQLIVLEPNDKEYKELASYKVADSQIHAYPVVAGNRIFIKDRDSVMLWTIE